ncbi:hypothetical protein [Bacillus sp. EB600]|nr:hypothetical protein [Bacillus sp. EB600]
MYAQKQKGNIKEQLRYIGRYIRRPAIGINRFVGRVMKRKKFL